MIIGLPISINAFNFTMAEKILNKVKIPFHFTVQNAETVRLISSGGKAISCTLLKPKDELFAYKGPGATHFGTSIKEDIIEK